MRGYLKGATTIIEGFATFTLAPRHERARYTVPAPENDPHHSDPYHADTRALAGDWQKVGRDLRAAISKVRGATPGSEVWEGED